MKRLGETSGFQMTYLDTLVHTGETLSKAIDGLRREQIRALADRFDANIHGLSTAQARKVVKRRLVEATGHVRESRSTSRVS